MHCWAAVPAWSMNSPRAHHVLLLPLAVGDVCRGGAWRSVHSPPPSLTPPKPYTPTPCPPELHAPAALLGTGSRLHAYPSPLALHSMLQLSYSFLPLLSTPSACHHFPTWWLEKALQQGQEEETLETKGAQQFPGWLQKQQQQQLCLEAICSLVGLGARGGRERSTCCPRWEQVGLSPMWSTAGAGPGEGPGWMQLISECLPAGQIQSAGMPDLAHEP